MVKSTSENALCDSALQKITKKKNPDRSRRQPLPEAGFRKPKANQLAKPLAQAATISAVFLVGFMGAGKTSVGRALGHRLNWIFEDLDDRIERREGRPIADIFRDSGEAAFRRAETAALAEALEESRAGVSRIVALGGGAFAQKANLSLLEAAGVATVFLDAAVDELWERCCQQASETGISRPLAQNVEQFRSLYHSRRKSYLQARLKIKTGGRAVETMAVHIEQALGLKGIAVRVEQGDQE